MKINEKMRLMYWTFLFKYIIFILSIASVNILVNSSYDIGGMIQMLVLL